MYEEKYYCTFSKTNFHNSVKYRSTTFDNSCMLTKECKKTKKTFKSINNTSLQLNKRGVAITHS